MRQPFLIAVLICLTLVSTSPAQTQPAEGRWDEISDRVVFLTRTLATVESSLAAVDQQIRVSGYKAAVKTDEARLHQRGNELMNRNLGMPSSIDWKDFYGRTAQRFFYHPTKGTNIYINPRPIQQRPPQFDYIYKANELAKRQALADAAALGGKVEALLKRRAELEAKQEALWTAIPFEAVAYQEITDKPLYRFELKAADQPLYQQHLAATQAGAAFVCLIDMAMSDAKDAMQSDAGVTLRQMQTHTDAAATNLEAKLLKQNLLSSELTSTDRPLQQLAAAAKRCAALARNLVDAHQLALESASAGDEAAKIQFRGVVQNSLLDYATMLMVADQSVQRMSEDWKVQPDTSKEIFQVVVAIAVPGSSSTTLRAASTNPRYPADATAHDGRHYKVFWEALDWDDADQLCRDMGGALAWPANESEQKFLQKLKGGGTAVWLGGYLGKSGWNWTKNGHPIHKSRLNTKPGDRCTILSSNGNLVGRPKSGYDPSAKVKDVRGFICQWDN